MWPSSSATVIFKSTLGSKLMFFPVLLLLTIRSFYYSDDDYWNTDWLFLSEVEWIHTISILHLPYWVIPRIYCTIPFPFQVRFAFSVSQWTLLHWYIAFISRAVVPSFVHWRNGKVSELNWQWMRKQELKKGRKLEQRRFKNERKVRVLNLIVKHETKRVLDSSLVFFSSPIGDWEWIKWHKSIDGRSQFIANWRGWAINSKEKSRWEL